MPASIAACLIGVGIILGGCAPEGGVGGGEVVAAVCGGFCEPGGGVVDAAGYGAVVGGY